jgi:hypothetical protein
MDGSNINLAELFPAAFDKSHVRASPPASLGNPSAVQPLPTKARVVLQLQLRGLPKTEVARRLRLSEKQVQCITHTDRYIAARDVMLDRMDAEFLAMKPMTFNALRSGLQRSDENTALRASEQWMRAVGFMHHGKNEAAQGVTAEDVAKQTLQLNVNVNINRGTGGLSSSN